MRGSRFSAQGTVHFWGGNRIRGTAGKQEGATDLDTISTAQVSQETAMKFVSSPQEGNLGPASHFSYLSPACGHALSGTLTAQTLIFVAHRRYESNDDSNFRCDVGRV